MEEDSSRARSSSSAAANEEAKADDLNYEYDDFNGNGQQLNIPNEGKPAVYPQQQALAHHILKRIKLSQKIQKQNFERFDSLDIQFYTANRLILESQTANRILTTPGVLPDNIASKIRTSDSAEVYKYIERRTQKYVHKRITKERLNELKEDAKKYPNRFFAIVFDEAHYSATGREDVHDKESPYEMLTSPWNSDDYPNVFVFQISATPWNLQTVNTRIENIDVIQNLQTGEISELDVASTDRYRREKFKLNEVKWINSHESDLRKGKMCRLVVLDSNDTTLELFHKWLKVDKITKYDKVWGEKTEINLGVSDKEEDADVFTLTGSIHGNICISTFIDNVEYFWTWNNSTPWNKSKISLEKKSEDYQCFIMTAKFGEQLCTFTTNKKNNLKKVRFDQKENKIILGKPELVDETRVQNFALAFEAKCGSTFMIMPMDNDSKFYLSLNYIFNSLRFEEKDHLMKKDDFMDSLFHSLQQVETEKSLGKVNNEKNVEKVNEKNFFKYQICDYCFILLTRPLVIEIRNAIIPENHLYEKCAEIVNVNGKFIEKLKSLQNRRGISPNTIQASDYLHYIKSLKHALIDEADGDEFQIVFWQFILAQILEEFPLSSVLREFEQVYEDFLHFSNSQDVESLMDCFGKTNEIIQSIVTKFNDKDHSGHMAIIRTNRRKHGQMLKQSLCVARHVAERYDFEIVEDYCSEGATLGDATKLRSHISKNVEEAKQKMNAIQLRILKKIQDDNCGETDRFGIPNCTECKKYVPENDEFELRCQTCKHVHREFKSYEDLIGLPCLLILVNNGRMGDTFPQSLIAMDDRISHVPKSLKKNPVYLSIFAQEKGRICRYTTRSSNLPRLYLSTELYSALETNLRSDCAYYNFFVQQQWIDPKVKYNKTKFELIAKEGHIDAKKKKNMEGLVRKSRKNHFLVDAEPQCGKTGVYLDLISQLRAEIEQQTDEIDVESESDDEEFHDERRNEDDIDQFKTVVPYWKNLTTLELPKTVSHSKYTRFTGVYNYPVKYPPDFPGLITKSKAKARKNVQKHPIAVFTAQHSDEICSYTMPQRLMKIPIPQIMKDSETISINYPIHTHYENLFKNRTVPKNIRKIHGGLEEEKMICIMTPSFGRFGNARLNYNHLMLDTDGIVKPYIHLVFVRKNQFQLYKQIWGNLVGLVEIPNEMTDISEDVDNGGIGYSRRFIQRFCHEYNIKSFYMVDDAIVYLKKVQNEDNTGPELSCTTMIELHQELLKIGSVKQNVPEIHLEYDRHKDYPPDSNGDRSNVLASYSGPEKDYVFIGLKKSRNARPRWTIPSKRHCTSFFWINNDVLMKENILFEPWKAWEDLKICNDADVKNLNVVKISSFQFTKIHSRDNSSLYAWSDNDFEIEGPAMESNQSKVESVLMKFLKEQRIKEIRNPEENKKFSEMEGKINGKRLNGGMIVVFVTNFENFEIQENCLSKFLVIMPLTNDLYDKHKCEEDFTASINSSNLLELKIFSTHRPRVTSDYWIISVTMKQNNSEEVMQKSNSSPELERVSNKKIIEMLEELRDEQRQMRKDQRIMHEDLKALKCQIMQNKMVLHDVQDSSSISRDKINPHTPNLDINEGDLVSVDRDEAFVKSEFEKIPYLRYKWDESIKSWLGNTYKVIDISSRTLKFLTLTSPDGSQNSNCSFPLTVVTKIKGKGIGKKSQTQNKSSESTNTRSPISTPLNNSNSDALHRLVPNSTSTETPSLPSTTNSQPQSSASIVQDVRPPKSSVVTPTSSPPKQKQSKLSAFIRAEERAQQMLLEQLQQNLQQQQDEQSLAAAMLHARGGSRGRGRGRGPRRGGHGIGRGSTKPADATLAPAAAAVDEGQPLSNKEAPGPAGPRSSARLTPTSSPPKQKQSKLSAFIRAEERAQQMLLEQLQQKLQQQQDEQSLAAAMLPARGGSQGRGRGRGPRRGGHGIGRGSTKPADATLAGQPLSNTAAPGPAGTRSSARIPRPEVSITVEPMDPPQGGGGSVLARLPSARLPRQSISSPEAQSRPGVPSQPRPTGPGDLGVTHDSSFIYKELPIGTYIRKRKDEDNQQDFTNSKIPKK